MENMITPADIAAVTRDDHRDGFFGEGGFFWIVVLFLIFGMMGGGGFGWGNNAATQGAITRGELYEGFNTNAILQNQNGLMRDQFGLQRDILENRFDAQKCCCDTQKEILESRYTTQLGFQAQHSQQAQCGCDIKTAIHAEGEATRALINANTMQELRDNLQAAQLQLGNLSQTQTLINALRPCPIPAYPSCSPYQVASWNYNGCNNGCGCC